MRWHQKSCNKYISNRGVRFPKKDSHHGLGSKEGSHGINRWSNKNLKCSVGLNYHENDVLEAVPCVGIRNRLIGIAGYLDL